LSGCSISGHNVFHRLLHRLPVQISLMELQRQRLDFVALVVLVLLTNKHLLLVLLLLFYQLRLQLILTVSYLLLCQLMALLLLGEGRLVLLRL
jgi:hypothetical protein